MSGADELDEAIALANSGRTRPEPPPAPRLKRIRRIEWGENAESAGSAMGPMGEHQDHGRPGEAGGHGGRGTGGERGQHGEHGPHGDKRDGDERGSGGRGGAGSTGPVPPGHPGEGPGRHRNGPPQHTPEAPRGGAHHPAEGSGKADQPGHAQGPGNSARKPPPSWREAVALAASAATALPAETVPLAHALGRTLATPLRALTDLPSFDTSAMDGWAVSGPGPWEPARAADGTERPGVLAGDRSEPPQLADGEAVRIATGARIPPGTSAVLRSEAAQRTGARLRTATPPQPGTDIRPRGQECRRGDELLPAGLTVTPAVLGLAAAAGYDELSAVPRPRAEVLVLGDELLHRGLPRDGRIRDALGPMVEPWLTALGAEVTVTRLLGDDAEALHEAVATTTADVVVTTGGTASGPVDHLQPTLRRLEAQLLVHGVRVRPGHPMLLAALGPATAPRGAGKQPRNRYLVGLPGNPLAALSGLVTLAAPLLRALAGRTEPEARAATLGAEVSGHPRDTRLVPVRYEGSGIRARIRPLRYSGPAMLRGVASCDALAVVPPGGGAPGTDVPVLELPW
ncbi:molybdopterin molybdotransferase MoeA [Streptomyces sp. 891-h]|uniref:molybdopterin molybdotransferase MoeA n=1 Tax=Streptomyces sp. 891-h TaxID=2720714 RepID=UPI001FAA69D8|nr:molybdopterin molybdotransferase MoeA [Streptomyces sp. 891-h]UNZ18355.1 molybdopterin molybdotransferase MoeA [Streptomyces sp. 891-h]